MSMHGDVSTNRERSSMSSSPHYGPVRRYAYTALTDALVPAPDARPPTPRPAAPTRLTPPSHPATQGPSGEPMWKRRADRRDCHAQSQPTPRPRSTTNQS